MKFELVEFYPAEEQANGKSKKGFVGTVHIYLADYGIDIRGIGVCVNTGRMFFNMPNRVVNNHESGFVFKYPIITWRNDSVNKELMDFLHDKVKPIVLESLNSKTDNRVT